MQKRLFLVSRPQLEQHQKLVYTKLKEALKNLQHFMDSKPQSNILIFQLTTTIYIVKT